jgi:2-iminobutanoate/2-iminopropanoate deaminase
MMDHNTAYDERLSRRSLTARGLAVGLAVPAAGALAVTGVAAQATPVAADRVAVIPREFYSSAIIANGFVFASGALGIDPDTGDLAGDDITAQTEQALTNLEATLQAAGSSLDRAVKTTCFITDLADLEAFNVAYISFFPSEPPARSTVQVAGLALGSLVEIDVVALI